MQDVICKRGPIELRLGRWQDVLADVAQCDAVITDPPYGERTHGKQRHGRRPDQVCAGTSGWVSSCGLGYEPITQTDVVSFVDYWSPIVSGWFAIFTCSQMFSDYQQSLESSGMYCFAPLACVQRGMNVRLAGDGPSNWTTWLAVARPRHAPYSKWGTLPGAYIGNPFDPGENTATAHRRSPVVGSKPLWLMRAIVRDYSRPGDLIVDPCAGGATTLIAAAIEGRRAIGAEMDPETFRKACRRIDGGWTPDLFNGEVASETI